MPVSLRVLLIEDNRELALLTAELLRLKGQEVEVAFDGEQGYAAAERFRPQVVICDLRLPGASGMEVAQKLREQLAPNVPLLVAITADPTAILEEHLSQTPFDRVLTKPLTWEQFQDCCPPGPQASGER